MGARQASERAPARKSEESEAGQGKAARHLEKDKGALAEPAQLKEILRRERHKAVPPVVLHIVDRVLIVLHRAPEQGIDRPKKQGRAGAYDCEMEHAAQIPPPQKTEQHDPARAAKHEDRGEGIGDTGGAEESTGCGAPEAERVGFPPQQHRNQDQKDTRVGGVGFTFRGIVNEVLGYSEKKEGETRGEWAKEAPDKLPEKQERDDRSHKGGQPHGVNGGAEGVHRGLLAPEIEGRGHLGKLQRAQQAEKAAFIETRRQLGSHRARGRGHRENGPGAAPGRRPATQGWPSQARGPHAPGVCETPFPLSVLP